MATKTGLTEFERQRLLKELAEISAEVAATQRRTAQLVAKLTGPSSASQARPA